MNPKYEALFTPFKIGEVEIPNRIVQCSMGGTTLFGWLEPSHFDLEGADFLLKRAKDGVGLVLPGMQVIRDTMGRKWLDSNRQMYRVLKPYMDEYHKTGGKLLSCSSSWPAASAVRWPSPPGWPRWAETTC